MFKISMLYICTGEYVTFWENFYNSFEKNFLPNSSKEYFVFTDAESIYNEENSKVHKIISPKLEWPYPTLYKFKFFNKVSKELKNFDYAFFVNANGFCNKVINEEELLPQSEDLVVAQNLGYINKNINEFPYDRNRKSNAYIPFDEGEVYVMGGFFGGKISPFLKLVDTLEKNTDDDLKNGVIALWHDESHLNKYILEYPNYKLVSPSYVYPEGYDSNFEPKIIMLRKRDIIPEKKIKRKPLGIINWKSIKPYKKFQYFMYKLRK